MKGESTDTYRRHVQAALDLNRTSSSTTAQTWSRTLIKERPELAKKIVGSTEETTTGIVALKRC